MGSFFRTIKHNQEKKNMRTTCMMKNGENLLKKLIASCDGKYNPIRSFSSEQLKTATDNYDKEKVIEFDSFKILYRGFLGNRPISVMKFLDSIDRGYAYNSSFNNMVFASQMNHKNILKLIGCCLETKIPILVFESVEYGYLDQLIYGCQAQVEPLLLVHRLKIAMEIANAIAYLHVGFSRPIVFRDIRPSNILICEEHVAKLFDFSISMAIPEGETHIKDSVPLGTMGFIAPEYVSTCNFNEKCDVYSFGVTLLMLLTGQRVDNPSGPDVGDEDFSLLDLVKKYFGNNRLDEIADPVIVGDGLCPEKKHQLEAFAKLSLKCVSESAQDRPTMVDVAKQLRQLYQTGKF